MEITEQPRRSPWPHRLTVLLALVTFPLIWVGGLVTTYDAGMAVPDWPGTYGYNLLLYPWQTWIAGPWDLFIEHGHRLLGATAGLVSIALVVACCIDRRPWLIAAAGGALALVIFQGALGGARVVFDQRLVALLHGCVGPLFFAYLAGLMVVTSRWWSAAASVSSSEGQRFVRTAWTTVGMVYLQLVLGALLRHIPLSAAPTVFRGTLILHLVVATAVVSHLVLAAWRVRRLPAGVAGSSKPATLLVALVVGQLLLGIVTYVAKYAFPAWLGDYAFAANYVVQEKSLMQAISTTAHVANGSLILFVSVLMAVRSQRLFLQRASGLACFFACQTGMPAPLAGGATA